MADMDVDKFETATDVLDANLELVVEAKLAAKEMTAIDAPLLVNDLDIIFA